MRERLKVCQDISRTGLLRARERSCGRKARQRNLEYILC
jgi:hypothetical protein